MFNIILTEVEIQETLGHLDQEFKTVTAAIIAEYNLTAEQIVQLKEGSGKALEKIKYGFLEYYRFLNKFSAEVGKK